MKQSKQRLGTGRRDFLKQVTTATALHPLVSTASKEKIDALSTPRSAIEFPRVFRGNQLGTIAFPLGGIGTGSISLGGRGQLRDWEIFNRPDKGNSPEYAFPCIWVKRRRGKAVTKILEGSLQPPYEGEMGLGWANAPGMPRLEGTVFSGAFPFATVDFADPSLPVTARLEAFSPFVPIDPESSSLPVAVLRYRVHNPGPGDARVAIAWNLSNPAGRDGDNDYRDSPHVSGLFMHDPDMDPSDPLWGSLALCVTADSGIVSHTASWEISTWSSPLLPFWEDLSDDGTLAPANFQSTIRTPKGKPPVGKVGSLCATQDIPEGEDRAFTFLLAWHYPNRTPERCSWSAPKGEEKTRIGNHYSRRFGDAWEAATFAAEHLGELESGTRAFLEAMNETTLPEVVLDAAMSNLSTLRTNTCFQTADGRFHGFEGCYNENGCCFGSCTHVWNYELMLAHLFPTYSRSLRETQFEYATNDDGRMDFRYHLPLGKESLGFAAADGQMGVLIKLYLDWRLSGDTAWLRRLWPKAKKALEFAWIPGGWDEDQDGVMEGCQHNTYDIEFFGPNPLMGVWYLGALRAGEEMARGVGDDKAAQRYRSLFEKGSAWIDEHLFNGDFYVQKIQGRPISKIAKGLILSTGRIGDPESPINQMGEGCLADQLLGQGIAHLAGLGSLLNHDHETRALESIFRNNFKKDLNEHRGAFRTYALNDEAGLILCDFSQKPPPEKPFYFSSEVWTGIEYQVASHLFHEGKYDEGIKLVEAVRRRHDGERRNPWNEPECGHHYARALASWSCILSLSGFQYHARDAQIGLTPRMPSNPAVGFWSVSTGWGTYSHRVTSGSASIELTVVRGKLQCQEISLGSIGSLAPQSATATLGRDSLALSLKRRDSDVMVTLSKRVELTPGKSLWLRVY